MKIHLTELAEWQINQTEEYFWDTRRDPKRLTEHVKG